MTAIDASGVWEGFYSYPDGSGPMTPFIATIRDSDGKLTGTIVEPNMMGCSSASLGSVISGYRHGRSIDFTKLYDGASDAAHAVDYAGRLSEDGTVISGAWSLADLDGTFEMYRSSAAGALEALDAETTV